MPQALAVLIVVLVLIAAGHQVHWVASASAPVVGAFSPAQLREDLVFLRDAVARRHPRFHQAPLSTELLDYFAEIEAELHTPMTRSEAYRHFARLNPAFRDAHTLLMPTFGDSDDSSAPKLFPFGLRLDPTGSLRLRAAWVRQGDGARLAAGTRIESINGVASAELLQALAAYGHGETSALQLHMLTVMFPHWLSAVRGWVDEFELGFIANGALQTLRVMRDDVWSPESAAASSLLPSLCMLDEGIALLRLPTFDVDEAVEAYQSAIDAAFAQMKTARADALIIDVRGNTGGQSDAGAYVIRYLIDAPVNQVSRARERLNEDNRGLFAYRGRIGEMHEMDLSRDERIEPRDAATRFDGPIVLLIDAMTYSAGILFATALQDHRIATLVGQPTGGYANQTGNMEPIHLPHTRLLAYIPAREFIRPSGDVRVGPVIPDIVVDPLLPGSDPTLAVAIEHARAATKL